MKRRQWGINKIKIHLYIDACKCHYETHYYITKNN